MIEIYFVAKEIPKQTYANPNTGSSITASITISIKIKKMQKKV